MTGGKRGQRLRVLVLSPAGDLYGSTRSLLEALDRIGEGTVEPIWGVPTEGPLAAEIRARGQRYEVIDGLIAHRAGASLAERVDELGRRLPSGIAQTARVARRQGVDFIHSNSAAVLAGAYAARVIGKPHLWYVREMIPDRGALSAMLRRQIEARSDVLVCNSRPVAAQFSPAAGARVICPGIEWDRLDPGAAGEWRERMGLPADAFVVGSSGYLNPRKGMDALLEAYAKARPQLGETARLVIAGEPFAGNEDFADGLKQRATELGLASELLLPGYLDEIGPFLGALDAFAFVPREPEGLGRSLVEAMACRLPVIASSAGGILDIVDESDTGLLVSPGDSEEIAAALARLAGDRELRERLSANGYESVRERFDLGRTSADLLEAYRHMGVNR